MNLAESLAREIRRVSELLYLYVEVGRMPNVNVGPALMLMDAVLDRACIACGSNDVPAMLAAHADLKGFEK